jgi:hypothetical protein
VHGGESLAQSKHLEEMALAASVHLHLHEMSKPCNSPKRNTPPLYTKAKQNDCTQLV